MTQNEIVEQAKQGNVKAIAALMNRLLKSQGMLATLERTGDSLDILIESDLRSPDDEIRVPKRPILVGMLKKWFITLEIQGINIVTIAWQKTGLDEPVWTEEIRLGESNLADSEDITAGTERSPQKMPLPPLPTLVTKANNAPIQNTVAAQNTIATSNATASPDLDEMFGGNFDDDASDEISDDIGGDMNGAIASNFNSDVLLLSDVPPIPDANFTDVELTNSQSSNPQNSPSVNAIDLPPRNLLTTANFQWQFLQYLAVCAIIIFSLNLIHRVLGSSPNPNSTQPAPTSSIIPLGDYFG